jgi:betaine reductase
MRMFRVVHYLNQFFGGMGGEEHGDLPPRWVDGPVGPGKLLHARLSPRAGLVGTVVCGDNYINQHEAEAVEAILEHVRRAGADALVAGPAFGAGRYGVACGLVCKACRAGLGIPALTAMHEENPGVDVARPALIVATPDTALGMQDALAAVSRLVLKSCAGEPLGPAAEEGYLPTGVKRNVRASRTGAERAVEMLLSKIAGAPYRTEIPLLRADVVPPAPPLDDLGRETLAVVTTGGIVPRGNPDRLESRRASRWVRYSIAGLADLRPEEFECIHGGFDGTEANADPDRVVPLDALRALEAAHEVGRVHDWFYITAGNAAPLDRAQAFGRELADELRREKIRAVVFTAT